MVNPVNLKSQPGQPPASKSATAQPGKSSQVFSPGDLRALRQRIKPDGEGPDPNDGQDEAVDAEAQPGSRTRSVSSRQQAGAPKRGGGQLARAMSRSLPDRSFSRPPAEFEVQPAVDGSAVLVSADGKSLHNLHGPVAEAICEHLRSTSPRTERPTVWLEHIFGRVPIKAIQDYLDQVETDQGNAIFIHEDGRLDVGTMQNTSPEASCVYVVKRSDGS